MMLDWNAYQSELSKTIPQFAKLSPDSLKGYQTLSAANSANSHLGEKNPPTCLPCCRGHHPLRWLHHLPH